MSTFSSLIADPIQRRTELLSACRFCDYLQTGSPGDDRWSVIYETEKLVAVPSIGALIDGWLLVVPKVHALSFGALRIDEIRTLVADVRRVADGWQRIFGPLLWFEHGPAVDRCAPGCGIDHAHLHLVPASDLDLLTGAKRMFPSLEFREVSGLEAARGLFRQRQSYLFLQTVTGGCWLASSADIPSQAFRRVIAAEQGRSAEFDWASFPRLDRVRATLRRSSGFVLPT
jgi:ATP adenylyltransferase